MSARILLFGRAMGHRRTFSLLSCIAFILVCAIQEASACEWYADGTMAFAIDPAQTPGPILATVTQPAVKCGVGLPFSVRAASANAGGTMAPCPITGLLNNGAGQLIPYTMTCLADGVGQGTTASDPPVEFGVGGSVAIADYQDAAVGSAYSDQITFQITY